MHGKRTAWNAKAEMHYNRLMKDLRLMGLWKWHEVAMDILAADIPMQTGTIPAERFWAYFLDLWPSSAKTVSLSTYMVMARICFLRYNYQLYSTGHLPPWCRRDPLLAQRLDAMASCVQAVLDQSNGAVDLLFHAFQP